MEGKFPQNAKQVKTNDLAWNNFEQSLESLLRDRRKPEPCAGSLSEPPPPPSPCSTVSDQLPIFSPPHLMDGDQVTQHPIPTITSVSTRSMAMHNYSTSTPPIVPPPTITPQCPLCPSPSPFVGTSPDCREHHMVSHQHVEFVCAACGHRVVEYEEMVKHVETEHVGDDEELVRASIIVPDNVQLLKTFQCGLKTCGRRLVGLTELALKEHIRRKHGEFYIHMGQGRNLVRLCRLCPGVRYVSDQVLTDHIQQEHPLSIFANGECSEFLQALAPTPTSSEQQVDVRQPVEEGEVARERLDVWYFRDQNQNRVHQEGGEYYLPNQSRNQQANSENFKFQERSSINVERESRREKYEGRNLYVKSDRVEREHSRGDEEDEKFSISPLEPGEERMQLDLKYKLKNSREAKKAVKTKVFCHACNSLSLDWENHKYGLNHIKNNKKARCLYCPARVWFNKLKSHVQARHEGCSFSCNATKNCSVRLMDLDKLTDHINKKHSDQVDRLRQQFCKNSDLKFVSSFYLGKSNFFLHPTDLRKLTCKLCGLKFLGQDQAALTEHFQLEHSGLARRSYNGSILYECRACESMLFGSQEYLLEHFRQAHPHTGLDMTRESEENGRKMNMSHEEHYGNSGRSIPRFHTDLGVEMHARSDINANNLQRLREVEDPSRWRASLCRSFKENSRDLDVRGNRDKVFQQSGNRKRRYSESCNTNREEVRMKDQDPVYPRRKRLYSEVACPSVQDDDFYYQSDEDSVVVCTFCDKKCLQSRLLNHMKKKHKENLFSCDGSCGKKCKSAWRSELLTHLKTVHRLSLSDSILYRHYLMLPTSNAMISCKVPDCDNAIFLCLSVTQVEKQMTRHVEKYHKGRPAGEWFNLGCRSCSAVFKTDQVVEWEKHLALDHRVKDNMKLQICKTKKKGMTESDDDSSNIQERNEERLVRLVAGPASVIDIKDDFALLVCKFCGEMVEEKTIAEHVEASHLDKLFKCVTCQEVGKRWIGQTASELIDHAKQDHKIDLKFEDIPPPEDQDIILSICSVCQAQFFISDPSILATHLLDHDMGPDMKQVLKCCRICFSVNDSKSPVENVVDHCKQIHSGSRTTFPLMNVEIEEVPIEPSENCEDVTIASHSTCSTGAAAP